MEPMQIKVGDVFHKPLRSMTRDDIINIMFNKKEISLEVRTQEQADRINAGEDVEKVLSSLKPQDLASTKE